MLHNAIVDAGGDVVVRVEIDPQFRTRLHLAQPDPDAITVERDGVRVQFDLAGARRAEGLSIDWVDDERGRGLSIDNPNAPPPVRALSPVDAMARIADGSVTLIDVRPREERAMASVTVPFMTLDDGLAPFESLPKDTPLAFLCHHGNRSQQAAEHFRQQGFGEVYNVIGGIDAWADVDDSVPKY
jgi:monothiol glutaredoxin